MSVAATKRLPQRFGRYVLLDRLGWGGMAEIFLALAKGEGGFEKYLVIKRILPHLTADPQFVKMFLREAKLAALLQHANIVQIFDVGRADGEPFIAMEYIEGAALNVILRLCGERQKALPVPLALVIGRDLLQGLSYAHGYKNPRGQSPNIVHRDISPSNVLVSIHGQAKLSDFGVARAEDSEPLTRTGGLKGKISYLAPEQIAGAPPDQRGDVFAAGIVMHEILTNQRLFRGETDSHTMWNIQHADVPKPSALRSDVPAEIDAVVLKAVARDPNERYQTSAEFLRELNSACAAAGVNGTYEQVAALVDELVGKDLVTRRDRLAEMDAGYDALARLAGNNTAPTVSTLDEPAEETMTAGATPSTRTGPNLPSGPEQETRSGVTRDLSGHRQGPPSSQTESTAQRGKRGRTHAGKRGNALWVVAVAFMVAGAGVGWWLSTRHVSGAQPDTLAPPPSKRAASPASQQTPTSRPTSVAKLTKQPVAATPSERAGATSKPTAVAVKKVAPVRGTKTTKPRHRVTRPHPRRRDTPSARAAGGVGSLEIITIPWTEVTLDGKRLGTTPVRKKDVPAGSYTLRLKNPEAKIDVSQKVTIEGGKVTRVARKLR